MAWEPTDAPPNNVEFEISLGAAQTGFVEVKSPGWESELNPSELKGGRAKREKYGNEVTARAASPVETIRRTVTKALPKFTGAKPTLLVISDDCFVNLAEWGYGPLQMALMQRSLGYGPGLFHDPAHRAVGGVALFWASRFTEHEVGYSSICLANPNAGTASLPLELVSKLCTKPTEPVPHLIEPGLRSRF